MEKVKLKIVTFNVSCDTNERFAPRLELAKRHFAEEKPDIIGFQEPRPGQQQMIAEALPDYTVIGYGREKHFDGESNCVAFKTADFTLLGFHQCWLSPTPFVPGTRFEEQSSCPRVVVTLMLKHKDRDMPFRFYNTHLDHVSDLARVLGMGQILKRMEADNADWELPMILTGDMNAEPYSEAIRAAKNAPKYPLEDMTAELERTFHNYGTDKGNTKIDYIFANKGTEHGIPYCWNDTENGLYISDHYPVACDVII